jgi:hypothetical protein
MGAKSLRGFWDTSPSQSGYGRRGLRIPPARWVRLIKLRFPSVHSGKSQHECRNLGFLYSGFDLNGPVLRNSPPSAVRRFPPIWCIRLGNRAIFPAPQDRSGEPAPFVELMREHSRPTMAGAVRSAHYGRIHP